MIIFSNSNLFNEENAINHVNRLAFSRKASTDGEIKTLNYITDELKRRNIEFKIDTFQWAKNFMILLKSGFLITLLFTIIYEIILFFPNIIWMIILLNFLLLVILLIILENLLNLKRIKYIGRKNESDNLITTIQAKDLYRKRPVIIFTAHYDSKSYKYSNTLIRTLYISIVCSFLIYFIITTFLSLWVFITLWKILIINDLFLTIRNLIFIIGLLLSSLLIIILFNHIKNESVGSIDNASGIAILLELVKLVKSNPLNKIDIIFLWCGAEEWGLWGSRQYCKKHFEELDSDYDLNKSYLINVDMVGSYIGLVDKVGFFKKKEMNKNINNVIKTTAKKMKIKINPEHDIFGAGSDHKTFRLFSKIYKRNGFQVCHFNSNKDMKYIHSIRDTPEKCSAETLNNCIELCNNTIRSIDLRVE